MEDILFLHTAKETADLLKVSLREVYALVERRELAAIRIGRRIGIADADLREFVEKNRQPARFAVQSTHGRITATASRP